MTQEQLVDSFISGNESMSGEARNLRIVQNKLIHYQTPIAERVNGKIYINMTRYSLVTSRLQKMLIERVPQDQQIIVKKVGEGTKRSLAEFASEKEE